MDFASRVEQSPRSRREILFRARRSIGARSSRAYLGVAGFRGGGLVDVLQGRKIILDFFDLGTHGVSGALEQCGRSGRGGGKVFFGAKRERKIFWRNASRSRTNGRSWDFASSLVIARALYARRSTLDRVPPDAPRRTTAATRSFHVIFSASRSHFSTAAAGTSPLSPPCSTHVSFGLGGGASASPGGSPKNLMA